MGKGDKKSRKGKIWRKSYGNTRPRKVAAAAPAAAPKKAAAKKSAKKEKAG